MPRVNNEVSAVAARLLEKVALLLSEHDSYLEVREDMKALEPNSKGYARLSDYILRIEESRASTIESLFNMHKKATSENYQTVIEFFLTFALNSIDDAPIESATKFRKTVVELMNSLESRGIEVSSQLSDTLSDLA